MTCMVTGALLVQPISSFTVSKYWVVICGEAAGLEIVESLSPVAGDH